MISTFIQINNTNTYKIDLVKFNFNKRIKRTVSLLVFINM